MKSQASSIGVGVVVVALTLAMGSEVFCTSFKADVDTLQLVQVIFRHGDRAQTAQYPNDPLNITQIWPEGLAQLTSKGKMQQYKLGQYLRRRYSDYLSDKYHSNELYVVSSDMDRTIMSVESNLAGLFPPTHRWHPRLDWQPIPLRTIPWKDDMYLHYNAKCPKYDLLHHEFLQSSDTVRSLNDENKDFITELSKLSGVRAVTVKEIIPLQDILFTQWSHNLTIPQWALDALPRLNELQSHVNSWGTFTKEMKRLKGGPLLDLLLKNMIAARKKGGFVRPAIEDRHSYVVGGNRKMLMYSAHDSTLSRIMNTIGIFFPHNPPYASALMIELHKSQSDDGSDHFVKIFYKNETDSPPFPLDIPSCPSPCYLDNLSLSMDDLIPRDLLDECQLEDKAPVLASPALLVSQPDLKIMQPNFACPRIMTDDPLVIILVGVILIVLISFLWVCLFKLCNCCNNDWSSDSGGDKWRRFSQRRHYEII